MTKKNDLTKQDLDEIVSLHLKHLPDGLLTALGKPFLKEFYSALNVDPNVFIFVNRSATGLAGFITGGTSLSGVKYYFLKNAFHSIWLLRYCFFFNLLLFIKIK